MSTTQIISEDQLSKTIIASLNNIVENEGFVEHKKYVRALSTNGGNFLGDLFEVDIKGKSTNGEKEINLFIKQIRHENTPSFINSQVLLDREILVYGELATLYTQLMNDANIPETERYRQAKCYEATDDFIILENLTVKGYETLDRTAPLTFSFADLAIKQLAKFHALSFVLQNKHSEFFNTNIKQTTFAMSFDSDFFTIIKNSFDMSYDLLDENSVKRLRAAYGEISDIGKYYGETRRCLCHGDYRNNNLMIKQENGTIVDLLPVDFQLVYFGNPMNDFFYLLICHSDQEFRRKHLTTLKEIYYDTLTQFLKYFDIDVSSVYPRKEFEVEYKERLIYGLLLAIISLSALFAREDAPFDLCDGNSIKTKVKLQDGAKERIQGIVDDYIKWGII